MKLISIEDFIADDGMTEKQITMDLNELYSVINQRTNVRSSDYRCYVTPQQILLVLFLKDVSGLDKSTLTKSILDDTNIGTYAIKDVEVLLDKETFNAEVDSPPSGKIDIAEMTVYPVGNFRLYQLASLEDLKSRPDLKEIVNKILGIEGIDLSTLKALLVHLDISAISNTTKIKDTDRYIIANTVKVFLSDIEDSPDSEHYTREFGSNIINYFYPPYNDTDLEESQMTDEALSTLIYLLGTPPVPFSRRTVIVEGTEISIKTYLLFCLSYLAYRLQRKADLSKPMRKNTKRYINYAKEMLSGSRSFNINAFINYLTVLNPEFNPNHPTQKDKDNLKELILILDNRLEYYYHYLAQSMEVLFGEGHRPRNRLLHLFGFPTIGNDTKV